MNNSVGNSNLYASEIECVKLVLKFEGISGFYRGFIPCALRKIPSMVVTFGLFEHFTSAFGLKGRV